jgi:dienelactone hydrolase
MSGDDGGGRGWADRFGRIVRATAASFLIATALAGCSSRHPRLEVDPPTTLFDGPLNVRISGAAAGQQVRLEASATDGRGRVWSSNATFVAGSDGTVDVSTASPVAGGTYSGAHDTGLVWSMASTDPDDYYFVPLSNTMVLHLTAKINGRTVGDAQVSRLWRAPGVTEHRLTLQQDGIDGVMFAPADTKTPHAAVLNLGGSEGSLSIDQAVALASHGYPSLVIAYFGDAGLPATLTDIPLEYFANALRWLARQPGVDPNRIAVAGVSRGSEAALLLGVDYPDLVHAVLALSPSSVVNSALAEANKSAWTLHGTEVPFIAYTPSTRLTAADHPEAAIPVERIRGPIFLLCGESDLIWPSCTYTAEIAARRSTNHAPYPDVSITEPEAGHFVGSPVPDIPATIGFLQRGQRTLTVGGTQETDALGRLDAWPQLLAFLANLAT